MTDDDRDGGPLFARGYDNSAGERPLGSAISGRWKGHLNHVNLRNPTG